MAGEAENNLIKRADLARVREVEFVELFNESIKKLTEALGVTRKIAKQAGTVLKSYKATGTLQSGNVDEGAVIPLSKYTTQAVNYAEITLKKWRKATSAEAIIDRGYDQAVEMTTDRMLKDVQKGIRTDFFTFLEEGTGVASGQTFQATLAQIWGQLQVKFEDDEIDSVYFMNPLDVADYLATAQISLQTAFGMTYVENFLGLGTTIFNSNVPKGRIYGTAKDNIVLYYVPANGADLQEVFAFTTDESGYIGIHEEADYTRLTAEDTVISGIVLLAERIDGVVVGHIDSTPTLGGLTVSSAAGTASGDTKITITEAKQAATDKYVYKVDTAAVDVAYGENVKPATGGWTLWDGSADITATTGKVITIVEADTKNKAQAAGHATVTAKT